MPSRCEDLSQRLQILRSAGEVRPHGREEVTEALAYRGLQVLRMKVPRAVRLGQLREVLVHHVPAELRGALDSKGSVRKENQPGHLRHEVVLRLLWRAERFLDLSSDLFG